MCICIFLYVYVFTKGCIFVSRSVCAGGEWGSVVCLCVEGPGCSPDLAGNCNGPCPVQKTARASHLQAEWPLYPEDINLHLAQQQHEQQDNETCYQHTLCLAVNQNRKCKVFLGSFEYLLFLDELLYIVYLYMIGLIPV